MSYEDQEAGLLKMGWRNCFRDQLTTEERQSLVVARIVEPARGLSRVACGLGEIWAEDADGVGVGDWVVGPVRGAGDGEKRLAVKRVLDRATKLSRTAPSGKRFEQILCANADYAFIVVALTQQLHLPGIERAVTAAKSGGVAPVLILTKADACPSPAEVVGPIEKAIGDLPIHVVSVAEKIGCEPLVRYFDGANTVVLLGASGAGKSTLVNHFVEGDTQAVGATRERDEKGRHTTTSRRLHFLPSGGMIVDSPGIRELQPWVEPVIPTKSPKSKKARPPKRQGRYHEDDDE